METLHLLNDSMRFSVVSFLVKVERRKKQCYVHFKWHRFHNEVGCSSLLWIEFTLHFGISG